MTASLRLLLIGATPPFDLLAASAGDTLSAIDRAATLADAQAMLAGEATYDAIVLDAASVVVSAAEVEAIAARAALVAVVIEPDAEHALGWLRRGADDVLAPKSWAARPAGGACASRSSGGAVVEGRQLAYATDRRRACRIASSCSSI